MVHSKQVLRLLAVESEPMIGLPIQFPVRCENGPITQMITGVAILPRGL